nr:MAG TPA: hypothetical protein [Caudoviricetes sp.]
MSSLKKDYLEVTIDVARINRLFKELNMNTDEARRALKRGLAASARLIQRQAKTNLGAVHNQASGTLLSTTNLKKWVRYVVYKRTLGFRVHIQESRGSSKKENPSFLLKFFEEGTDERFNKRIKKERMFSRRLRKERYTGKISASHFFSTASKSKIGEAQSTLQKHIERHIQKIANKR